MITCIAHPGQQEPDVIQAIESPIPEVNGFRLIWFRSSAKCRRDAEKRHDATVRAHKALEQLAEKLLKPRCRLKKIQSVHKAVEEILDQIRAKRWIDYKVEHALVLTDQHDERGKRPGSPSKIRRTKRIKLQIKLAGAHRCRVCGFQKRWGCAPGDESL